MTVYSGNNGAVKIGSDTLGSVLSFDIEETSETIRSDTMGDTWTEALAGKKSWTGSIECLLDASDTAQTALTVGASVTFEGYPDGTTTGRIKLSGTGIVTKVGYGTDQDDANKRSFEMQGTGALTTGTAT